MVRLVDVARQAGVSVSVVSRVLSEDASLRIRDDTRAAVLRAAANLRYTPNHAGRALRLNHAGAIALLVPDLHNALFAEVFRGVEDGATESDLVLLLGRSDGLDHKDNFAARVREAGRIDGLIIQPRDESAAATAARVIPEDAPAVFINAHERGAIGFVALDDEYAGRLATEFLISLGHREIGLIGGLAQTSTARRREAGFKAALAAAGIARRRGWTTRLGYTPSAGREALRQLIALRERPTAVVVANANAAVGVLFAAREANVEVPAELTVVALHDIWIAEHTWPALTTVKLPTYEVGLEAARALTRLMAGGSREQTLISKPAPEVLLRGSHGPGPYS